VPFAACHEVQPAFKLHHCSAARCIRIASRQNCFQRVTRILLIYCRNRALLSHICPALSPGDLSLGGKPKIASGFLKSLGHCRPTTQTQAGLDERDPLNKLHVDRHKHGSSQLRQPRCTYSVHASQTAASPHSLHSGPPPVYLLQVTLHGQMQPFV